MSASRRWSSTLAIAALAAAAAILVILFERSPLPGAAIAVQVFRWLGPIAAGTLVLLAVATVLALALLPETRDQAPFEEPWLPAPEAPPIRGRSTLVTFIGLESTVGATTLAFNLGVLVAVEGSCREEAGIRRRPRPLCLLSDGQLTRSLGLDPKPLRQHVESHGGRISEEVIDLAHRHPSGCELLCIEPGLIDRHRLRLLRLAVERHYDLIVLDACLKDAWIQEAAEDVADALIFVGLPTEASLVAAAGAAERLQARHLLPRAMLLLNRLRSPIASDHLPFGRCTQLPEDPAAVAADDSSIPFALVPTSAAATSFLHLACRLLPEDFREAQHAA